MQQWYKCPQCGADLIYGTNPCPKCKASLAWSQQGPVLYIPPIDIPQQQEIQSNNAQQKKRLEIGNPIKINNITKLPKVSEAFIDHIRSHALVKDEWVPCPRCGQGTVEAPAGKAIGCLAGSAMIIWYIVFTGFAAIIVGIFFWPLSIGIIIGGIIGVFLLPILGTALGLVYRCKSCNYAWMFEDVQNYKSGLNP